MADRVHGGGDLNPISHLVIVLSLGKAHRTQRRNSLPRSFLQQGRVPDPKLLVTAGPAGRLPDWAIWVWSFPRPAQKLWLAGAELRGGVGVDRPRRFPQILYTQLIFTVLDPG